MPARGVEIENCQLKTGVWINQGLSTGSGFIEEIAPDLFLLLDDGVSYTHRGRKVFGQMLNGLIVVQDSQLKRLEEAVMEDPDECVIAVEVLVGPDGHIEYVIDSSGNEPEPFKRTTPASFILRHNALVDAKAHIRDLSDDQVIEQFQPPDENWS